jgi:hypothetical protein
VFRPFDQINVPASRLIELYQYDKIIADAIHIAQHFQAQRGGNP